MEIVVAQVVQNTAASLAGTVLLRKDDAEKPELSVTPAVVTSAVDHVPRPQIAKAKAIKLEFGVISALLTWEFAVVVLKLDVQRGQPVRIINVWSVRVIKSVKIRTKELLIVALNWRAIRVSSAYKIVIALTQRILNVLMMGSV